MNQSGHGKHSPGWAAPCALAVLALAATAGPMRAQARAQEDVDPPGRVARVSYVQGSVSLQSAGDDQWSAATINRPLTSGDRLWSDQDSRAELELGNAALRLGSGTAASFQGLDDHRVQLRLTAGTLIIKVRGIDADDSLEIDAPAAAVLLLRPGEYRVSIDPAGNTLVGVRGGEAQVDAGGHSIRLHTGQRSAFSGDNPVAEVESINEPDGFDRWSESREQRWTDDPAAQFVASDVVGYQDLNGNGDWRNVADYGYVWFPNTVAADWAPYRFGRWIWVSPWGWTWVDDAAWGFAPFHYGRWAYFERRWCWVPAPRHERAIYAPALVAWVGGRGRSISAGVDAGVGWFPLAPGEVYMPARHASPHYVRSINRSNTTIANAADIDRLYQNPVLQRNFRNRGAPGALTVVPEKSFTSAAPVARNIIHAPAEQWRTGVASGRAPDVAPAGQRAAGQYAGSRAAAPPPGAFDRPVNGPRVPAPRSDRQGLATGTVGGPPAAIPQQPSLAQPAHNAPPVLVPQPRLHVPERSEAFETSRQSQRLPVPAVQPPPPPQSPRQSPQSQQTQQFEQSQQQNQLESERRPQLDRQQQADRQQQSQLQQQQFNQGQHERIQQLPAPSPAQQPLRQPEQRQQPQQLQQPQRQPPPPQLPPAAGQRPPGRVESPEDLRPRGQTTRSRDWVAPTVVAFDKP